MEQKGKKYFKKNLLKQLHKSNERAYNINIETRERENKKIRGVGNDQSRKDRSYKMEYPRM